MIKLINSICREIVKAYPSAPIYIQKVPDGFDRPSFFVEFIIGSRRELSKAVMEGNYSLQVVYFEETDETGTVDMVKQLTNLETLDGLFGSSLQVEGTNRFAKVTNVGIDRRKQDIYLTVDLSLTRDIPVNDLDPATEMMGAIYLSENTGSIVTGDQYSENN